MTYRRLLPAFFLAALALSAARAAGQPSDPLGGLLEPFPEKTDFESDSSAVVQNAGHTKGSDFGLRLSSVESAGRYQLINTYPVNPTVGYDLFYLNIDSPAPTLPRRLADVSVSFASPLAKLGEDWFLAAGAGVGYAGDVPFSQGDGYYGRGLVLVGRQIGDDSALIFSLNYDGNRIIYPDVPIPAVTYFAQVTPDLSATVGLGVLSVEWKPVERLTLSLDYQAIEDLDARVEYEVAKGFTAFAAFDTVAEAFHSDRLDNNDRRLFFFQRRVEAGLRWNPAEQVGLVVGAGYAYDTRFERGFDDRETDLVERGSDTGYLRFGLEVRL